MFTPQLAQRALVFLLIGIVALVPLGRPLEALLFTPERRGFAVGTFVALLAATTMLKRAPLLQMLRECIRDTYRLLLLLLAIFIVMTIAQDAAEYVHFLVYSPLAFVLACTKRPFLHPAQVILCVLSISCLDEGLQALHPRRVFDPWDIVLNISAGIAGLCIFESLGPFWSMSPKSPNSQMRY